MNFKKRVNGSWTDTPHYIHNTSTDTITTLPAVVYPNAATATVGLKGNTVQSGTPTPDNPIMPQGCGNKTANLFDITAATSGKYVRDTDGTLGNYADTSATDYIDVSGINTLYPQYFTDERLVRQWAAFYDSSKTFVRGFSGYNRAITVPNDVAYVRLTVDNSYASNFTVSPLGLESYEPFGVKIPISSGGENLFDKTANYDVGGTTYNYTISGLDPDKYYTCSTNFERISGVSTASLYFNGGISLDNGVWSDTPRTFKPNYNGEIIVYIRYKADAGAPVIYDDVMAGTIWVMVNEGSEALPYEPYNRTTTPIYLGEVPTTRRIKKIIFDGTESWTITSGKFYYTLLPSYPINWLAAITSHFEVREDISATGCARFGGTATVPQNTFIFNYDNGAGGITSWKSYLAQQYAAGTPVTVWYVLATEETGIVNEPLRKIGDYADEVSGITIPTITGADSFDVLTTLKPSEVSLTYTGWHDAEVKEWDGSEWEGE